MYLLQLLIHVIEVWYSCSSTFVNLQLWEPTLFLLSYVLGKLFLLSGVHFSTVRVHARTHPHTHTHTHTPRGVPRNVLVLEA
jgi:hypothetical protein